MFSDIHAVEDYRCISARLGSLFPPPAWLSHPTFGLRTQTISARQTKTLVRIYLVKTGTSSQDIVSTIVRREYCRLRCPTKLAWVRSPVPTLALGSKSSALRNAYQILDGLETR